ncbi:MAG: NAD-binding protein [Cytophagaceae bacterium]|nr:NAD-binding protein [Cytophagaceae bacterium]MDW8455743.1 NAD-binding protein [Cytophagaceae bacterium]
MNLIQKLRYRFDNSLSRGPISVLSWLGIVILLFLVVSSLVIIAIEAIVGLDVEKRTSFWRAFYEGFYQLFSSGAINWDEPSMPFLISMAILCVVGLIFVSIFIGLVSSGIASKIEDLQRGRSKVMEKNHIVVYGWSSKIFEVLHQLILANESVAHNCIVVLANQDKVEMENAIREKIEDRKTSEIIVRSGTTTDVDDVNIANPQQARSILILPNETEHSDIDVIKTLMAIVNNKDRNKNKYNIVTEINDVSKIAVAKILGKDEISIIQTWDIISRIMVQSARQPGLSTVITELLSFQGNEIYFKHDHSLGGKTFKDIVFGFSNAVPMGIRRRDGKVLLNPEPNTVIQNEDKIICIAEDDNKISYSEKSEIIIYREAIHKDVAAAPAKSKILVIGWNYKAPTIIRELDHYVLPGSELTVAASVDYAETQLTNLKSTLSHLMLHYLQGDTTDYAFLQSLKLDTYDHLIILCYDHLSLQDADSRTLITLIQVRDLSEKLHAKFNIVTEMLDSRNKSLAELAKPDDFVISDNITSLMMAQLSENRELLTIFEELFSAHGVEIYLKPAADYVKLDTDINFYTLLEAAYLRNELCIGYRLNNNQTQPNFGVIINPSKEEKIRFSAGDKVIVIAG